MSSKFFHGSSVLLGNNTVPGVQLTPELKELIPKVLQACRDWGLDFYPTVVQLLTYDEISEIAAYGGFPVRFPHWSFGMEYEELQRGYEYGMHKIYEMVINCCELATSILTQDGKKRADEVLVGDRVMGPNGWRDVVAVKRQKASSVMEIACDELGNKIICTPNHKWKCVRNGSSVWVETKDIKAGDVIQAGSQYGYFLGKPAKLEWTHERIVSETRENVKSRLIPITPPSKMTVELAELMGVIAGDGSVGVRLASQILNVSVHKPLGDYKDYIANLFFKSFGRHPSVYEKKSVNVVSLSSKFAVDFMDCAGLKTGCTYKNKRVPWSIWSSSNEYRAAFIRGLFDTDGHCSKSLSLSCFNDELAKDVQLLLLEMGIRSKVFRVKNNHNDIALLTIKGKKNIRLFAQHIGFSLAYKSSALQVLASKDGRSGRGQPLPGVMEKVFERIDSLDKPPEWMYKWRRRTLSKNMTSNALWGFLNEAIQKGYETVFGDLLKLVEIPVYVVSSVRVLDEKQETIDIALDHDEHDFLANGLVSHNTNPCYIYNLASNTLVDHLTVVAHATGHNDFFKNNIHFSATDTNMLNRMANHGTRIRRYMARWGKERVTEFIDHVMRLETLIDGAEAWTEKVVKEKNIRDERHYHMPRRLHVSKDRMYMEPFLNTPEFKRRENEKVHQQDVAAELGVFKEPTKNILGFLRDNAPLKPWQADIVSMLYEEALYFFPQRQTKVLNEGWACGERNTLVPTDRGILTLGEIVENQLPVVVYDGENERKVTNWFTFENRAVYRIETRRGYVFKGSNNHRIMGDQDWVRLDAMTTGQSVKISCSDIWTEELQPIEYQPDQKRVELSEIARRASVSMYQVSYRKYHYKGEEKGDQLGLLLKDYDSQTTTHMRNKRNSISLPFFMDEDFASFLGYMVGDGHISQNKRTLGLTTGDKEQCDDYALLLTKLFGLKYKVRWDDSSKNGRYRISASSKELEGLLVHLGMKTGICARIKEIPEIILKSPKRVVASFIRSYFDCDGYAGKAGVILSTSSEVMSRQIQNVLLNFRILSTRRKQKDSCWHVRITGSEAKKYQEQIGFGLKRKQEKLEKYLSSHRWFVEQKLEDEVVSVEKVGTDTVYDITVETTHRYAAAGFVNHNSSVDSAIMAEEGLIGLGQSTHDSGIVEYAAHKMGVLGGKYSTNPYKLGYYLLKDIRERWDKGQFGREWEECTDLVKKENWNIPTNKGKEKIFEVRKYYDDLTFIHEFFTEEFCRKQEYFYWKKYPNGEFRLESRDYEKIKKSLMMRHLNGGLPDIRLTEPNFGGKGIMMLQHEFDGRGLYGPYIAHVLNSLHYIWGNDVILSTNEESGREKVYYCNGVTEDRVRLIDRNKFFND